MKTIKLFLALSLLSFLTSNAQITRGNWMVGGDASFYNQKAESESSSSEGTGFYISPKIGYFPIDKLAIGVGPRFSYAKTKGNSEASKSYGIGVFTRYYILKPEKMINLFTHLEYNYSIGYYGSSKTGNLNNFIVKAGPVIYFNSSVGLELTLNYESLKRNNENGSDSTFKNLNLGVGFQIHLEK